MKKNLLITFAAALALFFYGYLASTVGHDHDSHGDSHVEEKYEDHGHGDHEHDHQH